MASKNGYIKDIYASSGEIIKNKEDYVQKGDIIVSGNIHRNDNVVARVKSNALVYAEVWYSSNVKLPLNYTKSKTTGKKRYNFAVNDKKIFRSRLKNYATKKKKLFKIFGVNFILLREY